MVSYVLHNFTCNMHKKTGAPLPVPTYPRLDRAKTGVFSIAAPAGGAANRECRAIGVVLGHGATRNVRYRSGGPRPPAQVARRGIPRDRIDASGAYAATPAC